MATLGEIIKEYRNSHSEKISIRKFALMSGLSASYISMLEKGYDQRGNKISPTISTINAVAEAMNKSFDEVFNQLEGNVIVNESKFYDLAHDEKVLIENYRNLSDAEKEMLQRVAAYSKGIMEGKYGNT